MQTTADAHKTEHSSIKKRKALLNISNKSLGTLWIVNIYYNLRLNQPFNFYICMYTNKYIY